MPLTTIQVRPEDWRLVTGYWIAGHRNWKWTWPWTWTWTSTSWDLRRLRHYRARTATSWRWIWPPDVVNKATALLFPVLTTLRPRMGFDNHPWTRGLDLALDNTQHTYRYHFSFVHILIITIINNTYPYHKLKLILIQRGGPRPAYQNQTEWTKSKK